MPPPSPGPSAGSYHVLAIPRCSNPEAVSVATTTFSRFEASPPAAFCSPRLRTLSLGLLPPACPCSRHRPSSGLLLLCPRVPTKPGSLARGRPAVHHQGLSSSPSLGSARCSSPAGLQGSCRSVTWPRACMSCRSVTLCLEPPSLPRSHCQLVAVCPPVSPPLRSRPCLGPSALPERTGILTFLCEVKNAIERDLLPYQAEGSHEQGWALIICASQIPTVAPSTSWHLIKLFLANEC